MSEYDCIHGCDISKYKCPKCEAGFFNSEEIVKQARYGSKPLLLLASILRKFQK